MEIPPLDWTHRLALLVGAALVGLPLCALLPPLLRALGLERTNFQGQPLGNAAGLLFLLGVLPWLLAREPAPDRVAAITAAGFGILGFIDDRWGTAEHKGLRGHVGAFLRGRVTTGFLKAAGGVGLAAWAAWALVPGPRALPAAALIALTANLFNLLDLRPLRALKVFWLLALPLAWAAGPLLAQSFGLSLPYARLEGRRRVMLGDTGANALGGLLAVAAVQVLPWWGQAAAVGVLVAFHAWTERCSLTAWIERTPWARRIDGWGWRTD